MKKSLYKKGLVLGIIVLFVGASIIPSTIGTFEKKTTFTGSNSPGYIQDLIDNASAGDTIYIPSGTYYENIVINKSISLVGEDKDTTIIDGGGNGDVIDISADWVNISGFTIQNSSRSGILLSSSNNIITDNNIISNNRDGIKLYAYFVSTDNNTITGNNISSNNGDGIVLDYSRRNFITDNNIISNNGDGINFYAYFGSTDNNTITGNNISSNNGDGIAIWQGGSSNTITGNNISSNNRSGIMFSYHLKNDNNNIKGNNISSNNEDGILLDYSRRNNTVTDNNIISNNGNGIYISYSGNIITGNNIINNSNGINLRHSSGNIITDNNIISNNEDGINFYAYFGSTDNNTITGNNISSNNGDGIYLNVSSGNNTIYHNNFINNTRNAYDEGDNTWDDGEYGNYWSDYEEKYPDAKKRIFKGIWDTPYEIPGGDNKDNCPLINQYPKSVIKSKSIDKPFNYNFPLLKWLFERFSYTYSLISHLFRLLPICRLRI